MHVHTEADYTSCGGDLAELKTYLLGKALWDPASYSDATAAADADTFLRGFYGEAREPLASIAASSIADLACLHILKGPMPTTASPQHRSPPPPFPARFDPARPRRPECGATWTSSSAPPTRLRSTWANPCRTTQPTSRLPHCSTEPTRSRARATRPPRPPRQTRRHGASTSRRSPFGTSTPRNILAACPV